tara:strand:+ start:373 stop:714 length:342 start_codon:yes stop_codon:yes gene_type:complete
MVKKIKIAPITEALQSWSVKKDVTDFIKERLGLQGSNGRNHAEEIIDNAIGKAKLEERPEWTKLLLDSVKVDKIKDVGQTNIFLNANAIADETLKKLVNVTPTQTKSKIEELI